METSIIYQAAPGFTGIIFPVNDSDNLLAGNLRNQLRLLSKTLQKVKALYPQLVQDDFMLEISDGLMTLIRERVIKWVGFAIFDENTQLVIQEWRFDIQPEKSVPLSLLADQRVLSEIPFEELDIPDSAVFICHIVYSPQFESLPVNEKYNIFSDTPWIFDSEKLLEERVNSQNAWWHREEWYQTSFILVGQVTGEKTTFTISHQTEWIPVAAFPNKCVKGKTYHLYVQLKPKNQAQLVEDQQQLKILTIITCDAFDINGPYFKPMLINLSANYSDEVVFELVPKQDAEFGEKDIYIDFFLDAQRIGNIGFRTLLANPKPGQQTDVNGDSIFLGSGVRYSSTSPRILLLASPGDSQLYYDVVYGENASLPLGNGRKVSEAKAIDYMLGFLNTAERFNSRQYSPERYETIKINLQAIGNELYDLFPAELKEFMANLSEGTIIQIHYRSGLEWIPWEMVFDGSNYWGEKFIITRLSRKGTHPTSAAVVLSKLVHFLSTNVSRSSDTITRAEKLFVKLGVDDATAYVSKDATTVNFKSVVLSAIPNLIHFTCHGGGGKTPVLYLISLQDPDNVLTTSIVKMMEFNPNSLVFANACMSGQVASILGDFISFGSAFVEKGSRAFIGTLATVPVELALEFADKFYSYVLIKHYTIGKALWQTKQDFKNSSNPFWLFYCLYGDGDFVIEQEKNIFALQDATLH